MANIENIRATIELIETTQGPERQFHMGEWVTQAGGNDVHTDPEVCGTAMCFAGWAVIAAGGVVRTNRRALCGRTAYFPYFVGSDGNQIDPASFSKEWLGLPDDNIFYDYSIRDTAELRVQLKERYGVDV